MAVGRVDHDRRWTWRGPETMNDVIERTGNLSYDGLCAVWPLVGVHRIRHRCVAWCVAADPAVLALELLVHRRTSGEATSTARNRQQ